MIKSEKALKISEKLTNIQNKIYKMTSEYVQMNQGNELEMSYIKNNKVRLSNLKGVYFRSALKDMDFK